MTHVDLWQWYRLPSDETPVQVTGCPSETTAMTRTLSGETKVVEIAALTGPIPTGRVCCKVVSPDISIDAVFNMEVDTVVFMDDCDDDQTLQSAGNCILQGMCSIMGITGIPDTTDADSMFRLTYYHYDLEYRNVSFRLRRMNDDFPEWALYVHGMCRPVRYIDDCIDNCYTFTQAVEKVKEMIDNSSLPSAKDAAKLA